MQTRSTTRAKTHKRTSLRSSTAESLVETRSMAKAKANKQKSLKANTTDMRAKKRSSPQSDAAEVCERCLSLNLFPCLRGIRKIDTCLGSISELTTSYCKICRFFADVVIFDGVAKHELSPIDQEIYLSQFPGKLLHLTWSSHGANNKIELNILVELPTALYTTEFITNSVLLPATVQRWISRCVNGGTHDRCHVQLSGPENIGIRLIDVEADCLVKASTNFRYVAVSYVGGEERGFEALRSNEHSLSLPGGITQIDNLSAVVVDAMEFCRSIGERYLWVDSLCVIQDGLEKHIDISHMDSIYEHALVTLVAPLARDASHGLPGTRSRPRSSIHLLKGLFISMPDSDGAITRFLVHPADQSLDKLIRDNAYEERGWTYQERILSRRLIYFTHRGCYYMCPSGIEAEFGRTGDAPYYLRQVFRIRLMNTPNMNKENLPSDMHVFMCYEHLLKIYIGRKFKYYKDILNAFKGISNVLEAQSKLSFTYGIPNGDFLHLSLLWCTYAPCERSDTEVELSNGSSLVLPSWTWAGWEGKSNMRPRPSALRTVTEAISNEYKVLWASIEIEAVLTVELLAPPEHPQLLQINTFTACLTKFSLRRWTKYDLRRTKFLLPGDLSLRNSNRYLCGFLTLMWQEDETDNAVLPILGKDCQLVLISKWRARKAFDYAKHDANKWSGQVFNHFCEVEDWDPESYTRECPWIMLVMLVKYKGEFAERMGIGCIHEDAWNEVQPKKRSVKLI